MVQSYKLPPALRKGSIRIKSVSIIVRLYESVSKKGGTGEGACLAQTKPWTKWCIPWEVEAGESEIQSNHPLNNEFKSCPDT